MSPSICKETIVTDLMEARRKNVKEKTMDELTAFQAHFPPSNFFGTIIFIPKMDSPLFDTDYATVADRNAMRIPANVANYLLGITERRFAIYDPVL